jgi:hypothetical protein
MVKKLPDMMPGDFVPMQELLELAAAGALDRTIKAPVAREAGAAMLLRERLMGLHTPGLEGNRRYQSTYLLKQI